jgi:hypothetical protein
MYTELNILDCCSPATQSNRDHGTAAASMRPRLCSRRSARGLRMMLVLMAGLFFAAGCGAINVGKWKGIERTASDEEYYLLKDAFLSAGSSYAPRETFDPNMQEVVNLFFIPRNEKNVYVAESTWTDPNGLEFRTIRQSYDKQREGKEGDERPKGGSTRVHTMSVRELHNHKPGMWKVTLKLDGKLARRLQFYVR